MGGGKPRSIARHIQQAGWLNNDFFILAFLGAFVDAGIEFSGDPLELFDFAYNEDLRYSQTDGRTHYCGGHEFDVPYGWKRFALNTKGKYEEDSQWLNQDDTGW